MVLKNERVSEEKAKILCRILENEGYSLEEIFATKPQKNYTNKHIKWLLEHGYILKIPCLKNKQTYHTIVTFKGIKAIHFTLGFNQMLKSLKKGMKRPPKCIDYCYEKYLNKQ